MLHRVATRYFAERYARMLLAMTKSDALAILGFPPYANPAPDEVQKAYRTKAFENHPDRGGSSAMMVDVNVAKDVLTGKTKERGSPSPPPPKPQYKPPEVVQVIPGVPFQQVAGKVPSGVDWKLVSQRTFAKPSDSASMWASAWVLIGEKDGKWVVAAFMYVDELTILDTSGGGLTEHGARWACNASTSLPIRSLKQPLKALPMLIKDVLSFEGGYSADMPKKWSLWPGGAVTEKDLQKIRTSGGVALKDALFAAGILKEDDKAMAGRKSVVTMRFVYNREKKDRLKATKRSMYTGYDLDFIVGVNGKEATLADDTVENLVKRFIPWTIGWDAIGDGNHRELTRMRGGRFKGGAAEALRYLADALTSEPSWLVIALEKAAEEWEPESKTAQLLRACEGATLHEAAQDLGVTLFELFQGLCQ